MPYAGTTPTPPNDMGRPQLSVTSLLLTVAGICLALALMFHGDHVITSTALFALVVTGLAFCVIGIIYGRESLRPFVIGAAFPLVLSLAWFVQHGTSPISSIEARIYGIEHYLVSERLHLGGGILSGIALGYLCVGFRWLIERHRR